MANGGSDDRTQLHPGGWSQQTYGSFDGKAPFVPPSEPVTQFHPGGWSQQLYGDFDGKTPFVPPPPGEIKYPVRPVRMGSLMTRG